MEIRLSERPLLIAVLVAFALWVLLQLAQQALWVLVVMIVATILAAAMMPAVNMVRRLRLPPQGWRIPKAIIVLFIYVFVGTILAAAAYLVGRLFLVQLLTFVDELPAIVENIALIANELAQQAGVPELVISPEAALAQAQDLVGAAAGFIGALVEQLFVIVFQLFMVLIIALFLVVESERILAFWVALFPPSQRDKVRYVTTQMGDKVGYWVIGQMAVAISVGLLSGLALYLVGMPYAAAIGLMVALLDLAPAVGPSIMAIPVFFLGLTESLILAVVGAAVLLIISELDAHLLTPLITGRVIELSRVVIVIAVLLGLALYGAVGALVAIPLAASVQVLVTAVVLPWLQSQHLDTEGRCRMGGAWGSRD